MAPAPPIEPEAQTLRNRATAPQPLVESLTNREIDVLEFLAQRLQKKEIAAELSISSETVKTHVQNICQKVQVGNRREAVAKAGTLGLLEHR